MPDLSDNQFEERTILSVSQLNNSAKQLLEQAFRTVWLEGEISNLVRPRSGHVYLSLKDSDAQLRAAMFRGVATKVGFQPKDGMQVLVRGRISLYTPRGDFQLIIDHMEEAGLGALQRAYEALKQRLQQEGLFDEQHKQPIPLRPKTIGVITSPSGAAIHDILSVLKRRFPLTNVIVYPALVQGTEAPVALLKALEQANRRHECDVLIIGRGGGSLEDLWCFNDEALARAIFASEIPIVSAVGHQVDFTIADFAADTRAPTPSAAAELLCANAEDLLAELTRQEQRLADRMIRDIRLKQQQLHGLSQRLQHPGKRLNELGQRLDELDFRLQQAIARKINEHHRQLNTTLARFKSRRPDQLIALYGKELARAQRELARCIQQALDQARLQSAHLAQRLQTVSPLNTLARGYSITQDVEGTVIQSTEQVKLGQELITRLRQGELRCTVNQVQSANND